MTSYQCDLVDILFCVLWFIIFCFKQSTAYEMRIRDWSSDVCSSDLADPKSHAALVAELTLALGDEGRLDLLVNGAGVLHSGERFGKVTAAILEDSFRTNAAGPLLLTPALAPLLADPSRVAHLSSELGSITDAGRFGTPRYCISKAAQNMASVLDRKS